jgi:hypothetical protein
MISAVRISSRMCINLTKFQFLADGVTRRCGSFLSSPLLCAIETVILVYAGCSKVPSRFSHPTAISPPFTPKPRKRLSRLVSTSLALISSHTKFSFFQSNLFALSTPIKSLITSHTSNSPAWCALGLAFPSVTMPSSKSGIYASRH